MAGPLSIANWAFSVSRVNTTHAHLWLWSDLVLFHSDIDSSLSMYAPVWSQCVDPDSLAMQNTPHGGLLDSGTKNHRQKSRCTGIDHFVGSSTITRAHISGSKSTNLTWCCGWDQRGAAEDSIYMTCVGGAQRLHIPNAPWCRAHSSDHLCLSRIRARSFSRLCSWC